MQSHTHTYKYTRHVNEAHQAALCRNHESRPFAVKEARTLWKQPSLKSISSCCLPPSSPLSSPVLQISYTSFRLFPLCGHILLRSGFLTCVQIGKLQDAELSLVKFMWSQGVCGKWRVREVLLRGAGQIKDDISPACAGLTLLILTAWLTLTTVVMWKGP